MYRERYTSPRSSRRPPRRTDDQERHRFRRGPLAIGITLLLVGLLVFGVSAVTSSTPLHGSVTTGSNSNWTITPSSLTSVSAKVSWSSPSSARAYVATGAPTCGHPTGVLANYSKAQGSFTVKLNPGPSYALFACNAGNHVAANFTVTYSGGFSAGDLIATILCVLGVLFLILALIPRRPDPFDI